MQVVPQSDFPRRVHAATYNHVHLRNPGSISSNRELHECDQYQSTTFVFDTSAKNAGKGGGRWWGMLMLMFVPWKGKEEMTKEGKLVDVDGGQLG